MAKDLGMLFIERSAQDNINIDEAFKQLTFKVIEGEEFKKTNKVTLSRAIEREKKTSCCK